MTPSSSNRAAVALYRNDPLFHQTIECLYQAAVKFHVDREAAEAAGCQYSYQVTNERFREQLTALLLAYDRGRASITKSLTDRVLACEMERPIQFVLPDLAT
jgi:hypothetical protein